MIWIITALGLVTGSFLNACIYRIPLGISITYPPSSCPKCNAKLKSWDLIPIVSWFLLRGHCRYCNSKISARYPFVEMLTCLCFVLIYRKFGINWYLIPYFNLAGVLIVSSFTDLDHRIIPNEVTLYGLISHIVINGITGFITWKSALVGGLIGGLFLLFLVVITKGSGMGLGDVKIMTVAGLYLGGMNTAVALMLAFLTGAVVSVCLIAFKVLNRKDAVPFGPFISLGCYISLIWGTDIVMWYASLFL